MDSVSVGVFNDLLVSRDDFNSKDIFVAKKSTNPKTLEGISTTAAPLWSSVKEFVDILGTLSIPGPLSVTDKLLPYNFIGRGGQFSVYENSLVSWNPSSPWHHPVVVKSCHITMETDQVLDLASQNTKNQIRDMYLEVLALSHTHLRRHRNIAKLLGWAQAMSYNAMPLLVMELAVGDLSAFLTRPASHDWSIKHQLCLDMCAGLDALHEHGIVHADFKPQNVLIFQGQNYQTPFIAKLSDFGFSILDVKVNSNNAVNITGWTEGWQAPEINYYRDAGKPITTKAYRKADIYSFGLVVWSVFCYSGRPPLVTMNSNAPTSAISMLEAIENIPNSLRQTCCVALERVLCYDPVNRPESIEFLFHDNSDPYRHWKSDCHVQSVAEADYLRLPEIPQDELATHKWALKDINRFHLEGIQQTFKKHANSVGNDDLFVGFLEGTDRSVGENITFTSAHIQMLLVSAENGFAPAQAVINRVFQSYNIDWPSEYIEKRLFWLLRGTEAGCMIAKSDLMKIDSSLAQNATATFFKDGAFREHYSTQLNDEQWAEAGNQNRVDKFDQTQNTRNKTISFNAPSRLARFSVGQGVDAHVEIHPMLKTETDLFNSEVLYKACLAGCSTVVRQLCRDGVKAGVFGKPNGATCLHWLFNFQPEDMNEIATLLINNGANVHSHLKTTRPAPRFFFPFTWPAGNPLHWAVGVSSTSAVAILLRHGIDCRSRNRVDPYKYDINCRNLSHYTTTSAGSSFSVPPGQPEGLSALDIAVANHDWTILDTIIATGCKETGVCDSDEEGYTPFHRLEDSWIGHTLSGSRFWHGAFWGPQTDRYDNILRTIKALQVMGGNINRLTSPSENNPRKGYLPENLTPLMLAVRKVDIDAARALLACGADPNIRNNLGLNALCLLPEAFSPGIPFQNLESLVKLLLKMGIDPVVPSKFKGWSPLASAIESRSLEAISLILEAGAYPSMKRGNIGLIAILLHNFNIYTHFAYRGTHQTREAKDNELARLVRDKVLGKGRAIVKEVMENVDPHGASLLHYAANSGLPKVVEVLIQAGAKVDVYRTLNTASSVDDRKTDRLCNCLAVGTPLDSVIRSRSQLVADSILNVRDEKPVDTAFMINVFDKIAEMLKPT